MKSFKPRCSCWQWCPGKLLGCSPTSTKAAGVADSIRTSLDQAGLKDVSASQDRDKGVVTLGGHVAAGGDKSKAKSIAKIHRVGPSCVEPDRNLGENVAQTFDRGQ